ncbi:MAG: 4Fe-4S dicluster domain-containing protein [Bacteroidetes bacterium]|nr:4Fe-4S dicluster domain-containing protein [Bacteroidota bacterium]
MSTVVNPDLNKKLAKFGNKSEWNECFHCGNCTAVCSLTEDGNLFPRKVIRQLQMGLKDKFISNVDPWLCYYCGECSETCPRDANPGEMMMSARRYLTSVYDWTGLSGLFYSSVPALIIGFVLVAVLMIGIGFTKHFNTEAIMDFGHHFEKYLILAVASLILTPNIIRMFWFTILKEKIKAPLISYIKEIWELILHMFTQINSLKCENNTFRWLEHLLIVFGYLLLLFTTVFLNWFSTENTFVIWLGYITGGVIFVFTFDFILSRIRKNKELSKFSHPSDWLFVIWLFLMGFTAFIVRILIDTDLISNNLWLYIVHLIIIAQWGILIVPFGKWTHFLYRSFAIYFANLKKTGLNV